MNDSSYITQCLDRYSEVFDLYLDTGATPPPEPDANPDPLRDYLLEALAEPSNYLHCQEDADWREVFKSAMLDFLGVMLRAYIPIEQYKQDEERLRLAFLDAPIDEKRRKWRDISSFLQEAYSADEVNVCGFLQQLQQASGQDELDSVFQAMDDAWREASAARIYQEEMQLLQQRRQNFERSVNEGGTADYHAILDSREIVARYPALREILYMIGRDKPQSKDLKDSVVTRYIPILLSHSPAKTEVDGVEVGNRIPDALPAELVYLAERETEDVFYHRFATSTLQLMASKPPTANKEKTDVRKAETPRLIKGPIIVSVDTSGSMLGRPMDLAKALLMQLLTMARKQRRPCYLITYSVHAQAIDLASPRNWRKVKNFLRNGFSGGTDGEEMLRKSIEALRGKTYSMADVLIISDFCWHEPSRDMLREMKKEQQQGTRFYGLEIGKGSSAQHQWLDRVWTVEI